MSISSLSAYHAAKDVAQPQPAPFVASANASAKAAEAVEAQQPSMNEIQQAVGTLNKFVASITPAIEFSTDEDSGKTIVKVIDNETQTVLRQIPSTEALEISKSLDRLQGLLVRHSV